VSKEPENHTKYKNTKNLKYNNITGVEIGSIIKYYDKK
jgi:hypothetical protein